MNTANKTLANRIAKSFFLFFALLAITTIVSSCSSSSDSESPDTPQTDDIVIKQGKPKQSEIVDTISFKPLEASIASDDVFISSDNPDFAEHITEYYHPDGVTPLIDILFVIDNSGSMIEEQTNLSKKFENLMASISNADWRIRVITTDKPCGMSGSAVISSEDPDASAKFIKEIQVGTGGSGTEKGLSMGIKHLDGSAGCSDWIREGSKLAVIFVTDEDDFDRDVTAQDYLNVLASLDRDPADDARTYAFINASKEICPKALNIGKKYVEAVEVTEGIHYPVCATDYSSQLEEISEDIASMLNFSVTLKGKPQKIKAQYEDTSFYNKYDLIEDKVILGEIPEPGSTIYFTYNFNIISSIQLKQTLAVGSTPEVLIAGKPVSHDKFRIDYNKNLVIFDEPLPIDTLIRINYKVKEEVKKTYSFPKVASADDIACRMKSDDGKDELIDFFYDADAANGATIMFYEPIPSGKEVLCQYKREIQY